MQAQMGKPQAQRGQKAGGGSGGLGRAIAYLGAQRKSAILAYVALALATLAQLAVPQLVQNMIDAVTSGSIARIIFKQVPEPMQAAAAQQAGTTIEQLRLDQTNAESLLINAALIIVAFAFMRGIFSFVQAYMAEKTSQGVAFDLRNQIFARVQRLSFSYYDQNQTGQLMIRATDDVEKVRTFIAQGLILTAQALLLLVGALVILFFTNWKLSLVVVPLLPVAMVMFMIFGKVSQPLFGVVQRKLSALNTILQENLAGIKVVKAFTREPYESQRFDLAATDLMSQQLRISKVFSFLFPVIFLVAQLGQAGILYFGGRQILGGTLDLGEYQKFSLYLVYVFFPLGQLGFIISLMAQAGASASRIFEILDAKSEITDKPDAQELPAIQGNVEFRNVTFRYFGSSDPVLRDVSFEAKPGQTIALLGATGSGKSTIINLLPRFYDVSEGAVLIDGHDLRDVKLDSLRSQIGIVLQETNLFSGSIRDNIAFGRPEATFEEVEAAAKAASAHDFIMTFPQGYDTSVGERGATLSGGQKQRIAIARALLLNPRLLILDDSTSSVDLMTEYRIQKALDQLMQGRTSVVIAQRISTVLNADQILVLEKGQVVARGNHEELMESSAIYAEIYNSQLVGDADIAALESSSVEEA
ncbi:ABC transporter ATP-binding protein [Herpetosiphon sp.]|uniref:ABC transporter related n=1 Tax=Herpetosiphon aurantiacus (strain ATCC 23779 / DSM 785 / 114-95) TaxID=316274 RepID=A9AZ50_HERA2|nr:ABC transporter ATP-binding protein [Herpetosiphon sp.]ABX03596.1 ABC transporter related [Herpetosiphon aurantiacus DSM 785]